MKEEWCQDQSCLFRRGDCRNKGHNPDKFLGSIPGEDGFCCSETKHNRRALPGLKLFVLARRITGTKAKTLKNYPGLNS
jgi:hypothetical protein